MAGDLGARDQGLADLDGGALADHQDVAELDGVAGSGIEFLDLHFFALAGAVLLATRLEYCVHRLFLGLLSPEWPIVPGGG